MPPNSLPRLLYLGDVPVEASYHGSALLYRLLLQYPADRLLVLEYLHKSVTERRLHGVEYRHANAAGTRLLSTRFHDLWSSFLSITANRIPRNISFQVDEFSPEAILTVAHGFSWMMAASIAHSRKLPIHLIIHDDWPSMVRAAQRVQRIVQRRFAQCYQAAASRLCISPYMVAEYQKRYGVEGKVLYPCRAPEISTSKDLLPRATELGPRLVYAFAGTINTVDLRNRLEVLAKEIDQVGSQLLLYGPFQKDDFHGTGLFRSNVLCPGLVSSHSIIQRLRHDADVLVAPFSFAERDRPNMSIHFPSKLADYTAAGLPILIWGPSYCSAVRWAHEHTDAAEVVETLNPPDVRRALRRLNSFSRRKQLATNAMLYGEEAFSHTAAWQVFSSSISSTMN